MSLFGALLYMAGGISLGSVSSFVLYSRKFSGPINEFANIISELQSALAAAERVFHLLDEAEEAPDAPGARSFPVCAAQWHCAACASATAARRCWTASRWPHSPARWLP